MTKQQSPEHGRALNCEMRVVTNRYNPRIPVIRIFHNYGDSNPPRGWGLGGETDLIQDPQTSNVKCQSHGGGLQGRFDNSTTKPMFGF